MERELLPVAADALGVEADALFFFRFDAADGTWRGVTRDGRKLCSARPSPEPSPGTPVPAVEEKPATGGKASADDKPQAKPAARKAKS